MSDSDQMPVLPKEQKRFYQQLLHCSQFRILRIFQTGSSIEIEGNDLSTQVCGVKLDKLDMDFMIYELDAYAFPTRQRVPDGYSGNVTRIVSDGMHPGYARLIDEKDYKELTCPSYSKEFVKVTTRHGPALRYVRSSQDQMLLKIGALTTYNSLSEKIVSVDSEAVFSVHCPYWPAEAYEWLTRRRPNGCPTKSVVKRVARYGCDFVCVAHKHSIGSNEWRFSFSYAELFIIRNWNSSQRLVYRTLRLLNKFIDRVAERKAGEFTICSYYFKTLMMWACEKRPKEFWEDHALVCSVQELLNEMAEWLVAKTCCNYFIPTNNMMDYLVDADLPSSLVALRFTSESPDLITSVLRMNAKEEFFISNMTRVTDLPAWIYNSLVIQSYHHNIRDSYGFLQYKYENYASNSQNIIHEALSPIYMALNSQQNEKILTPGSHSDCDKQLKTALRLWPFSDKALVEMPRLLIHTMFMECDSDCKATEAVSENSGQQQQTIHKRSRVRAQELYTVTESCSKTLIYLRARTNLMKSSVKKLHSASNAPVSTIEDLTFSVHSIYHTGDREIKFYRYWPGQSPTVNISWFIAKSYLANLYFTTRQDYNATVETCNEIIDVYHQSYWNRWFADHAFLVEVSTRWAGAYDGNIQALLGLCSLCTFVLNRPCSRSVYSGVFPIQFAYYLLVRSTLKQERFDDVEISDEECDTAYGPAGAVHSGSVLLEASLRIVWRSMKEKL